MKKHSQIANLKLYRDSKKRRLDKKNAIYTSRSQTTVMINYSETLHVLEVEFKDGKIYHYLQVDPLAWEEYKWVVKSGGSSGSFLNKKIKNVYQAEIVN